MLASLYDLVPIHDDPLVEYRQTLEGASIFDVSNHGHLEISGPEAPAFLHNLSTNDVKNLPLVRLDLSDTSVSDDGLAQLVQRLDVVFEVGIDETAVGEGVKRRQLAAQIGTDFVVERAAQLVDDVLGAHQELEALFVILLFQSAARLFAEADGAVEQQHLKLLGRGREHLGAEIVVGGLRIHNSITADLATIGRAMPAN